MSDELIELVSGPGDGETVMVDGDSESLVYRSISLSMKAETWFIYRRRKDDPVKFDYTGMK